MSEDLKVKKDPAIQQSWGGMGLPSRGNVRYKGPSVEKALTHSQNRQVEPYRQRARDVVVQAETRKSQTVQDLVPIAESWEIVLKQTNRNKTKHGRVQNREFLMFEKDCHSFCLEDGLVRAKWKQEGCCPGI